MHQFKAQPSSSEHTVQSLRGDLGLRSARKLGAPQGLHVLGTATHRLGAGARVQSHRTIQGGQEPKGWLVDALVDRDHAG